MHKPFFRLYYTDESITPTRRYLSAWDVADAFRQVSEIISGIPNGKYVTGSMQEYRELAWQTVPASPTEENYDSAKIRAVGERLLPHSVAQGHRIADMRPPTVDQIMAATGSDRLNSS